jgi:hypothetical protein
MNVAGGGGDRIRTRDPQLAKLVLYQLSYAPRLIRRSGCGFCVMCGRTRARCHSSYDDGGPEWIRTTYLALIRRVL